MSAELSIEMETGVVFRNPMAHVTSRHAYFPSAIPLGNGEVLVSYNVGEAFEAENLRVHLSRSLDGGRTWVDEGRLGVPEVPPGVSEGTKMAVDSDGKIVGLLQRHDRRELAGEGLTHTGTLGFVPTRFETTLSADGGRTWSEPCRVEPPIEGPEWELCAPITELSDGRWLLISSTWPDWSGRLPNGHQLVAFVSSDRGSSWPEWLPVMSEAGSEAVIFWESKIVELSDGRLLAVAWCHDLPAAEDRPNQYALSSDGGATWTPHRSTGLIGRRSRRSSLERVGCWSFTVGPTSRVCGYRMSGLKVTSGSMRRHGRCGGIARRGVRGWAIRWPRTFGRCGSVLHRSCGLTTGQCLSSSGVTRTMSA